MQSGAKPRFLFFWGHQPSPSGELIKTCLSQWWPSRFVVDGVEYATAEHYMMWSKARLFGDEVQGAAVLLASTPAEAKAIGRKVKNFDQDLWVKNRFRIVVEVSVAKFNSDPALKAYLLSTEDSVLVEASPRDRIWGIGMGASNDQAENPAQWRGLNLLGFALMEARELLQDR